jgi:IclR family transcriptional regulator, acetate operon repressor
MRQGLADSDARPAFQVLERTFGILEVFTEARPEWGTTGIARELDLPVPTVHRILVALKRLGYVTQNAETRRFRLGMAALSLGERTRTLADLRPIAIGPMRQLSDATGETALLTVLSPARDRSVCLERVETSQPLRLSVQPGRQLPLHAGASQKALLAFMPADEIDRLTAQPLERFCTATITRRSALRRELAAIRARGWSSSFEETNVGVWGIAVPVLSATDVVCAVGIAGPSPRLSDERVRRDVRLTHEAAAIIGRAVGLSVPPVTVSDAYIGPAAAQARQPAATVGVRPRDRSLR